MIDELELQTLFDCAPKRLKSLKHVSATRVLEVASLWRHPCFLSRSGHVYEHRPPSSIYVHLLQVSQHSLPPTTAHEYPRCPTECLPKTSTTRSTPLSTLPPLPKSRISRPTRYRASSSPYLYTSILQRLFGLATLAHARGRRRPQTSSMRTFLASPRKISPRSTRPPSLPTRRCLHRYPRLVPEPRHPEEPAQGLGQEEAHDTEVLALKLPSSARGTLTPLPVSRPRARGAARTKSSGARAASCPSPTSRARRGESCVASLLRGEGRGSTGVAAGARCSSTTGSGRSAI